MKYTIQDLADKYLEGETSAEELEDEFPEAYELLEHFAAAGNSNSTAEKRTHYYEAVDVVDEIIEKYGKDSEEYSQIQELKLYLQSTPGMR